MVNIAILIHIEIFWGIWQILAIGPILICSGYIGNVKNEMKYFPGFYSIMKVYYNEATKILYGSIRDPLFRCRRRPPILYWARSLKAHFYGVLHLVIYNIYFRFFPFDTFTQQLFNM